MKRETSQQKLLADELGGETVAPIKIESEAFEDGSILPERYSANGDNVSPPLSWSEAPAGTREWLLVCEDPDAPRDQAFVHWVVSLPEFVEALPEGASGKDLPRGAQEGKNDAQRVGYFGPQPPPGHGPHHYHFELFAIDTPFDPAKGADRETIVNALKGHVRGCGDLVGVYGASA